MPKGKDENPTRYDRIRKKDCWNDPFTQDEKDWLLDVVDAAKLLLEAAETTQADYDRLDYALAVLEEAADG